jgi:hypothetical protein
VSSTALAASMAAKEPLSAAIANECCRDLYDLQLIEKSIQDLSSNNDIGQSLKQTIQLASLSSQRMTVVHQREMTRPLFCFLQTRKKLGLSAMLCQSFVMPASTLPK